MYVLTKNNLPKQLRDAATHSRDELLQKFYTARTRTVSVVRTHPQILFVLPAVAASLFVQATMFHVDKPAVSFASNAGCFSKIVPFPGLQKTASSSSYSMHLGRIVSLGPVQLFAREACVNRNKLEQPGVSEALHFSLLGNGLIKQRVVVQTPVFPDLKTDSLNRGQISASEPLVMKTTDGNVVFDYRLASDAKSTICHKQPEQISCNVAELGLAQGQSYGLELSRVYKNQSSQIFKGDIRTATPVAITATSIAAGSTVLDKPQEIAITTNKKIASFTDIKLIAAGKTIETTVTKTDNTLKIVFAGVLPRDAEISLQIGNIVAEDYGQLDQAYALTFRTSAGPKVAGANIKAYGVSAGQPVTLTFDQDLLPGQNFASFVTLATAQGTVSANVSVSGRQITLTPATALAKCTAFTVRVTDGLQSSYGITGGSAWSMQSRTQCVTIGVIGYSVQGRPIYVYQFGSGTSRVMYVGNMHGNESGSKSLLDQWVNEIEANAHRIPADRMLLVIPTVNPDAYASGSRLNANGVDLNRNFPANDWSASVGVPGPQTLPQGGGTAPLSEPESSALAAYVQAQQPRVVLTFHSKGSLVIANGTGDSSALAKIYADNSPYWVGSDHQADEIFGYATTGEFEDWLHDKLNLPALLIEMSSHSSSEFIGNRAALWSMAIIP